MSKLGDKIRKDYNIGGSNEHVMDLTVQKSGYFKVTSPTKVYPMQLTNLLQLDNDGRLTILDYVKDVRISFNWNKTELPTFE